MAMAIGIVIIGAIIIASVTLQKSFQATSDYTLGLTAQTRVLDYIGLDLRRAITVNGTKTGTDSFDLNMTIPNYYDTSKPSAPVPRALNMPPTKASNGTLLFYGTGTIPVSYRQVGSTIVRIYNGVSTTLVSNVKSINLTSPAVTEPKMTVSITFTPDYHHGTAMDAAAQTATTQSATFLMRNSQKVTLD